MEQDKDTSHTKTHCIAYTNVTDKFNVELFGVFRLAVS